MKILEEAKNYFVVQAPNGAKVKIAKSGLSEKTLGKMQGYAEGGKVEYGASRENTLDTQKTDDFRQAFNGLKKEDKAKPKEAPRNVVSAQVPVGYNEGGEVPKPQKPSVDINLNVSGNAAQAPGQQKAPSADETLGAGWLPKAIGHAVMNTVGAVAQNPLGKAILTNDPSILTAPEPAPAAAVPAVETGPSKYDVPLSTDSSSKPSVTSISDQQAQLQNAGFLGPIGAYQAVSEGIAGEAGAIAQGAKEAQQAYNTYLGRESQFQKITDENQRQEQELRGQNQRLLDDIRTSKIEPKNMFSGKNTFQQIGTALAVLAGGISQGLTGARTNPVMDYIDRQIDQDIELQKIELGKKETLFSKNMQQLNNIDQSANRTRITMLTALQGKLMALAEKTKSQTAAAQFMQRAGELGLKIEPLIRKELMLTGLQNAADKGIGPTDFDQSYTIARQVVPENKQDDVAKELQRLESIKRGSAHIMDLFDKAVRAQKAGNRLTSTRLPFKEPPEVSVLRNALIPMMKEKEGVPREFEANTLEKTLPSGFFEPAKDIETKRKGMLEWVSDKYNSGLLRTYRIPYPSLDLQTGPQLGFTRTSTKK